jgi:hypothetical protein
MSQVLLRISGAILGAHLGGVLAFECFGCFLARKFFPFIMFNGWSSAVVDIMPGEEKALARLALWWGITVALGAFIGAVLGAAIAGSRSDRVGE